MRKTIIVTTLLIAVLIVGAPYVVGQVAEARQTRFVASYADSAGQGVLSTEEYETGWFTSTARHRFLLDNTGQWALIIDTKLAHGPWPGLDGSPGLVRMLSTLRVENGEDGFDIPGQVFTFVALDGSGVTNFEGEAVEAVVSQWPGFVRWDGGTFTIQFSGGFQTLDWTFQSSAFQAAAGPSEYELSALSFEGAAYLTDYGLWAGTSRLTLADLLLTDIDGARLTAGDLRLDTMVENRGEKVDHALLIAVADLDSSRLSDATFDFSASARNLDASALARLIDHQSAGSAPVHLNELVSAGSEFRIDRLTLRAAQGDVDARLDIELAPAETGQADPAILLNSATGNADVTISPGILSAVAGSVPQGADLAATLVALGYLTERNGDYVAEIRYRSGLLTINGLPMMIPGTLRGASPSQ